MNKKPKIQWYRERHIENLAKIRLLTRKNKLLQDKIIFLEYKYKRANNVVPTYQDLSIRVKQILHKNKSRKVKIE